MSKFLAAVVSSCVLSLSLFLGLEHWYPVDYSSVRNATYELRGAMGTCSGVMISPNLFLTAAHCEQDNMKIGDKPAAVLKKDEARDLMLLAVKMDCPCVPVAGSSPRVDTKLIVVGFPMHLGVQYLTEGRLQGLIPGYINFMAISAPVVFGNSGGPVVAVVNGEFKVIGIVSALAAGQVGFGFPYFVYHMGIVASTDSINTFLGK